MHSPKDFLLLECDGVKRVLHETLRYDYGGDGSRDFFEECEIRLDFIRNEIEQTDVADHLALQNGGSLLIELSHLISRIERSSLDEYSWPFVEELKEIALAICTEATIKDPHTPPKVHVLSDGGLDKYAIYAEPKRPSAGQRRILTIIFPRSLKHFVLLHPVLGHELGHAIWRGSEHEKTIRELIQNNLLSNAKFQSSDALAAWLYSANAPDEVKRTLNILEANRGITQDDFFGGFADASAWVEEIACDLIGLATFGPSFVSSLSELLYGLMPSGGGFGPVHPPNGCRANMMLQAITLLGYDQLILPSQTAQDLHREFWGQLHGQRQSNPWFDLFTDEELNRTLQAIRELLQQHPPSAYDSPRPEILSALVDELANQIPPNNFSLSDTGVPSFSKIDFRHILYAGWVAAQDATVTTFADMNRLCEHAIMQQRAIKHYTGG
ncbi:MAG: hypothetical protein V4641_16680 [Pseudomonadota bacterium]